MRQHSELDLSTCSSRMEALPQHQLQRQNASPGLSRCHTDPRAPKAGAKAVSRWPSNNTHRQTSGHTRPFRKQSALPFPRSGLARGLCPSLRKHTLPSPARRRPGCYRSPPLGLCGNGNGNHHRIRKRTPQHQPSHQLFPPYSSYMPLPVTVLTLTLCETDA